MKHVPIRRGHSSTGAVTGDTASGVEQGQGQAGIARGTQGSAHAYPTKRRRGRGCLSNQAGDATWGSVMKGSIGGGSSAGERVVAPSAGIGGQLEARWLAGEAGVLEELHARYRRRLEAVAYRIVGNRADAEDVVQRVFVALPRAAYAGTASLSSYLHRAVVNGSVNLLRARRRRAGLEREMLAQTRMSTRRDTGPEGRVLEGEILAAVARALLQVKEQHRRALVLRIHHGLSNVEIAEREQVPAATVGTWLRRGREELRRALAPLLRDVGSDSP